MLMKNPNDIIGNRTRDLPACSAVPQPTEPPWEEREDPYKRRKAVSTEKVKGSPWVGELVLHSGVGMTTERI